MQKKTWITKALKILMAILIGGVIIWLSVRQLSTDELGEIKAAFEQANYWWIFAALIVAFISNISRTKRWQMLLQPLGYRPRFVNVMLSVLVAYFANMGLPRLGEVARCGLLKTHEDIPFEKSFGTVVTERFLDLVVFLGLFLINFVIQFKKIHTFVEEEVFSQFSFNVSKTMGILGIAFLLLITIVYIFRRRLRQTPIYNKVAHLISGFWSGIISVLKVENVFLFIFHSLFIWLCYWAMAYLMLQSLPITQSLDVMASLSALTIGTIGMIVVQGGLGIYPLLIAGTLLSYHISYPTGYAMGWLIWGGQTLGIVSSGLIAIILIPILNKKKIQ